MKNWIRVTAFLSAAVVLAPAQNLSVSVNGGDYAPAKSISLDFGVGHTQNQFELGRFFALTVKNISGRALNIKEASGGLQPTFWATGVANTGSFTMAPNQERTITFKAKCPSCTSATPFKSTVTWTSGAATLFAISLTAVFGPQGVNGQQQLPHVVACCDKTWEYKDAIVPYPDYYHVTGWSSPNNWGPNNGDRASGWRITDVTNQPAARRLAIHYGIQSDECRPCIHPPNNTRSLDPILAFSWALDESSITATIEGPAINAKVEKLY